MQLSVKDTAKILNVSEKTIYRWIKQQVIPVYQINEQYRFNRSELLEWATSRRIQVSPEIFQETEQGKTPLPSLLDALKTGGISYRIGGGDKPTVLRAIVDILNLPEEVDRGFLYQVLMARETLGSTGIGEGIAIPHVRNPVVLHVSRPSMTLCFLDNPIDFGAIDGQPVSTLFTLISPTVRAHLHILSRLGFVLQNKDFKAALKKQASREDLMETLSRAETAIPALDTVQNAS
ncbi:MAG TPA: PTS fructose transporter subunit IIA [Phycisphaerales bacterium]|nr:MAG: PTS fructose transporter subunit IIA [Planctomycetes bacterium GWC2_45_44]HBG78459.1 PTS fructose transporter subunit IIA [Phycisphaerales bacterium]HBR19985.1 PTS fructose transporter subunit IIA [Phycisphaerales bacterium]